MENPLINTEKKKKTIINIIYYALLLALFYFFMKYAFGLLFPFMVAFVVAMALQKPINFVCKKTKINKGVVSGVMVFALVIVLGFLISMLGVKLWEAFCDFLAFLSRKFGDMPTFISNLGTWIVERTGFLPNSIENLVNEKVLSFVDSFNSPDNVAAASSVDVSSLFKNIDFSTIATSLGGIWDTAKQIPTVLLAVIISIFACCFMASDYDRLVVFLRRQFAGKSDNLSKAKRIVTTSFKNLIKAYLLIICITFAEMFIGLYALKILGIYKGSWIFFIALGTAIVDIFPVLGTGTILWPWSLYLFIAGDIPMAIGVIVLYVFITIMRQFIEPKLVAGQLGLPPFVTIIGMYIGARLFGIIGIFAVPLTIILIKLLNDEGIIHLWKTSRDTEKEKSDKESSGDTNDNVEKV